ncbi:MAG: glycoside hydrolase family 3 protein, partial [Lachnospiraceae bacterium]|nr:glycoside hydrolase family 3 protein [Lachnospiraceae bacterium]
MDNTKEYRMRFDEQARELLSQMTLEEKIYMLGGHSTLKDSMGGGSYNEVPYMFGGCERLGIPELGFCDGPRGVVSGNSTCFPAAMACGATFDRGLEKEIGHVIGKEIRGNGGSYFGGDCMNIPYNPGAGRSQEAFIEDSYHMGEMAVALMEGVQEEGVVACIKHYAFNSMERSRFKVSVTADKRTEREVYLPHFKKAVEAGAGSVMNAYNLYQGEKCGHNKYLLRDVLKDEWGFDGFVISDFMWGVKDTAGGLNGGCDVEMHVTNVYSEKKVKKALAEGTVTEDRIDDACLRIIRTTLAFEEQRKALPAMDKSILACDEHIALARRAASESITLLKNEDGILPLNKADDIAF